MQSDTLIPPRTSRRPKLRPELLDARGVGELLGMSPAKVWAMDAAGTLPAPIRLGGSTRWRRRELVRWCAAGCPCRQTWASREVGR